MSLFKLFGRSQKRVEKDKFGLLLNGIVRPLQYSAVEQINLSLRYIPEQDSQGRFMLLLMHVCLASILHKLENENGAPTDMSNAFEEFAISHWDLPSNTAHTLFNYTRQQIEDKLSSSDDEAIEDVGLTLLSMAQPNQEGFKIEAVTECGQAAYVCWQQAGLETDKALGRPLESDAGNMT